MEIGERKIYPLNLKIEERKIGERIICSLERKEGVRNTSKVKFKHYLYTFLFPPIALILVLIFSGNIFWHEGLLFFYISISMSYFISVYLILYNPALLLERFKFQSPDQDRNDKGFVKNIGRYLFLLFYIIIPIDQRYTLFPNFSLTTNYIAAFIVFLSYLIIFYVFKHNSFASPIIRNQKERNHQIISTGIYSVVRHPMYTACVLLFISLPVLLDSLYGIIIGIYLTIIFSKRIQIEEKFLLNEFQEYLNYKKKVKYKIFPYIY